MNGSLLANYIYLQLIGKTENYFRSLHNIHVCNYFLHKQKSIVVSGFAGLKREHEPWQRKTHHRLT